MRLLLLGLLLQARCLWVTPRCSSGGGAHRHAFCMTSSTANLCSLLHPCLLSSVCLPLSVSLGSVLAWALRGRALRGEMESAGTSTPPLQGPHPPAPIEKISAEIQSFILSAQRQLPGRTASLLPRSSGLSGAPAHQRLVSQTVDRAACAGAAAAASALLRNLSLKLLVPLAGPPRSSDPLRASSAPCRSSKSPRPACWAQAVLVREAGHAACHPRQSPGGMLWCGPRRMRSMRALPPGPQLLPLPAMCPSAQAAVRPLPSGSWIPSRTPSTM
jgi:hypothetical protein